MWVLLSTQTTSKAHLAPQAAPRSQATVVLFDGGSSTAPSLCSASLAVTLAQLTAASTGNAQVLMLTCGALSTDAAHAASDAAHGGVWGFARVQRLEQPTARVLSADVARSARAAMAASTLLAHSETEAVWCRDSACHGARLRV